jgi:hypothetical protein
MTLVRFAYLIPRPTGLSLINAPHFVLEFTVRTSMSRPKNTLLFGDAF